MTVRLLAATLAVTAQFVATVLFVVHVQQSAHTMLIGRYRSQMQLLGILVGVGLLAMLVMNGVSNAWVDVVFG